MDIDTLPDGIYCAELTIGSGFWRVEKKDGRWFFSDGTGWTLNMESPKYSIKRLTVFPPKE